MKIEGSITKNNNELGKIKDYLIDTDGRLIVLAEFEKLPKFRRIRYGKWNWGQNCLFFIGIGKRC